LGSVGYESCSERDRVDTGGAVRAILEVSGIQDIGRKMSGQHNPYNSVKAPVNGLTNLKDPDAVIKLRGRGEEETQEALG